MNRAFPAVALSVFFICLQSAGAQEKSPLATTPFSATAPDEFEHAVAPLLKTFCIACHGGEELQGGLSLQSIDREVGGNDFEIWRMIHERVQFGEMPPVDADLPTDSERTKLLTWIRTELMKTQQPGYALDPKLKLPQYGNYVDHAALFDEAAGPVIPDSPRIWRLRQRIYDNVVVGDVHLKAAHNLNDPLNMVGGGEFSDYAARYFIDEPAVGMLLANAEKIVSIRSQSALTLLTASDEPPQEETVALSIQQTFLQVMYRQPTTTESLRFAEFYRHVLAANGRQSAAERLLMAIYMQPEALFREELGEGMPDEHGRIRLSQREIALAVSYALGNSPDELLLEAAMKGELATQQQIVAQVKRRFDSPPKDSGNPRVLQFFREYFNYPQATEVFKNQPKRGAHLPQVLTTDLELLIDGIVARDRNVLFNLLTTNEYFVDCQRDPRTGRLSQTSVNSETESEQPDRGARPDVSNSEFATIYGMPRDWIWTDQQPVAVPRHMRAGVLTHPAWLVAWSGNFDNHPVQRGKWIRTHLLGGSVPDVPIGVEAIVPEDRTKQFRERLATATAAVECRRCHRKMDPLGLPFEQYDHYGRFRSREADRPVDVSGTIAFVEDETLAADVSGPLEMLHRLAKSTHVEQVFVRYAFRYFMGRNETIGDAKTLQDAHQSYREQGGNFRALVVSLLSSDSFLYRSVRRTP